MHVVTQSRTFWVSSKVLRAIFWVTFLNRRLLHMSFLKLAHRGKQGVWGFVKLKFSKKFRHNEMMSRYCYRILTYILIYYGLFKGQKHIKARYLFAFGPELQFSFTYIVLVDKWPLVICILALRYIWVSCFDKSCDQGKTWTTFHLAEQGGRGGKSNILVCSTLIQLISRSL